VERSQGTQACSDLPPDPGSQDPLIFSSLWSLASPVAVSLMSQFIDFFVYSKGKQEVHFYQ
jgi:hypothetical protein